MQVRPFARPPLPNKRTPPLPPSKRPIRIFQLKHTPSTLSRNCISREGKQNKYSNSKPINQPIQRSTLKRTNSVRSCSRDSVRSRESRRSTSKQKQGQRLKDKINHNLKARVAMPTITAKSWAVYELQGNKLIYGKRLSKRREIASLTKIMNLITIISIISEYQLEPVKIRIKISREASYMTGTSALLTENSELSLLDLYFGMMLPSGNDAAMQVAEVGGALLKMALVEERVPLKVVYHGEHFTNYVRKSGETAVMSYLKEMNRLARQIGMKNTHFANPHGLSNPENYSCAQDLCVLCAFCMQDQVFRWVAKTQLYTAWPLNSPPMPLSEIKLHPEVQPADSARLFLHWQNTNKMLKEGWSGIKTGITPNAGPCLAASVVKSAKGQAYEFLVVLINSASMEARWKQARDLVDWVVAEQLYL